MAIELSNVSSGYSTGVINDNFEAIEAYINDNLLNRDGTSTGEANQMKLSLDMNSNFIFNLPEPVLEHQAARLQDVQNALADNSANLITFTPYGNITSENVQGALQELVDGTGQSVTSSTGNQTLVGALNSREIWVEDLSSLKTLSVSNLLPNQALRITTSGRSGPFTWVSGDRSSDVSSDPQQGVWIAPDDDATGASGAWKRDTEGFVTPEMFGDDGTIGPALQASADWAANNNHRLVTGPGVYKPNTDTPFNIPSGLVWESLGSTIQQDSTDTSTSAIRFQSDDVIHIGKTKIVMAAAASGNAYRGHVLFGDWQTGAGPKNILFGDFFCEGGHENINGVSFAGDCANIRGHSVECGDDVKIGRLVMLHWANFDDHFLDAGTYEHATGADPTTHPHDIKINVIKSGRLSATASDFMSALVVSAGYDVDIGRVEGEVDNQGTGGSDLVLLTAGDLGFAYASSEEKAIRMRGIKISQVRGKVRLSGAIQSHGINRIGEALYHDSDSTPQAETDYFAWINDVCELVDVEGQEGICVNGSTYLGTSRYGKIIARGFNYGLQHTTRAGPVAIGSIEGLGVGFGAVFFSAAASPASDQPDSLEIGSVILNGFGGRSGTGEDAASMRIRNVRKGVHISHVSLENFDYTGAVAPLRLESGLNGVMLDSVVIDSTAIDGTVTFAVACTSTAQDKVFVDSVSAPSHVTTPVSGGVQAKASGRNVEYYYSSGTVPSGIEVKQGDKFWAASAGSGAAFLKIVHTAGTTGSDAVLGDYLVRP